MDRLLRLLAAGERLLVRLALLSLALLAVAQAVTVWSEGRWSWAFLDPGQGLPPSLPATAAPARLAVTLALDGPEAFPDLAVLVNGHRVASFARRWVTVEVLPGDLLAVDARCCGGPLVVRVAGASRAVVRPAAGDRFPLRGGRIVPLGRVVVSR